MTADSRSFAINVNFDTEIKAFDDEIYFGESGDNAQEIEIDSVDVSQPNVAPYRYEPC